MHIPFKQKDTLVEAECVYLTKRTGVYKVYWVPNGPTLFGWGL